MIETEAFDVPVPGVEGARFRSFRGAADIPAMVAANMAVRQANGVEEVVTVEGMTHQYANLSHVEIARDVAIIELDGSIVGYVRVEWSDQADGSRTYEAIPLLRPDALGRGVGSAMLAWAETRLREIAATHPAGQARWLSQETWDAEARSALLLTRNGYERVRSFFEMVRSDLDDVPPAELPDGFAIRPVGFAEMRAVWTAEMTAFRDNWDRPGDSEEAYARFVGDPRLDPSLHVVAFAGDEVAGAVLNLIDDTENAVHERRRGSLDGVFVRRPYRRRGLARALIVRSLELLRDRGMTSASLGVDAENPNAALDLYRSCGFEIHSSSSVWRKPFNIDGEET